MFIMPSFKKSLLVEQFQENYLKCGISWQKKIPVAIRTGPVYRLVFAIHTGF